MMRLRQLDLAAFGHFTDRTIDFGAAAQGGSDFHIVFGRNEAGKTTLMEGYLRLLFGFPTQDAYAFKHQRANLRVSAVLDIDGTAHALTRLSKRAPNLLDGQGQVIPDTILTNALGDLSVDDYRKLLCLDDETIEAGGEEITKSKGDIGRLLFSAAAGISDLSQVLDDVQARSLEIYRKGGTKSEFAGLKAELAQIQHKIKDQDISAPGYRGLRTALETATREETDLRAQKTALALRKLQLENLLKAHPLAAEWRDLDQQLRPIAHYPQSLDFDPEQVVDLMTKHLALSTKSDQLAVDMAALVTRRDALVPDAQALAAALPLGALDELKSRAQTGLLDLPRRQAELDQELSEMRRHLGDIGVPTGGDPARFVVGQSDLSRLEQLREAMQDAQKACDVARSEASDAGRKLRDAATSVSEAADHIAGDPALDRVIARIDAEDTLARFTAAEHDLAAIRQRKDSALRKLTRQDRVFSAPPLLTLDPTQAAALTVALADAELVGKQAEQNLAVALRRLADAQTQVTLAQAMPDLIDDAAAAVTRAHRDQLWETHKARLDQDTAQDFETAMLADDRQTRLRAAHSKELADHRQAQRRAGEAQSDHAQATQEHETALATVKELRHQLCVHLREHGLPETLTADDFAMWLRDAQEAAAAQADWTAVMAAQSSLRATVEKLQTELGAMLGHDDMSFAGLVRMAKGQIAQRAAQQQALKQAEANLRVAKAEAARRDAAALEAQARVETANQAWIDGVTRVIPDFQGDPLIWDGLNGLRSIRETESLIRKIRRQVDTMSDDIRDFDARLCAISLSGADDLGPLERFAAYQAQVTSAQEIERQRQELDHRYAAHETAAVETAQQLSILEDHAQLLAKAFAPQIPTGTLADLRVATSVAARAIDLRAQAHKVLTTLLAVLEVNTWKEAETLLADHPVNVAQVEYDSTAQELVRIETALDRAIEARTRAQVSLDGVGADAEIAALVARKRTVEAQMEDAVMRYLEGRFGHVLAEEAIRRYRDSHRSGMLAATEQAFCDLTQGAYTQLKTLPGTGGDILQAMQASDMTLKEAADMSKGTRFQLYLALRAAAYDQMAQNGRVLPFFCDDVFETFDEDRTRAACVLMQRIGRRGQAIYLTHHQHVVDIAREVCGDQVRVHSL